MSSSCRPRGDRGPHAAGDGGGLPGLRDRSRIGRRPHRHRRGPARRPRARHRSRPGTVQDAKRQCQTRRRHRPGQFRQQNLFETDLQPATVLTLYLLPSINVKLRPKILWTLRPGTRVVSHDFHDGRLAARPQRGRQLAHPFLGGAGAGGGPLAGALRRHRSFTSRSSRRSRSSRARPMTAATKARYATPGCALPPSRSRSTSMARRRRCAASSMATVCRDAAPAAPSGAPRARDIRERDSANVTPKTRMAGDCSRGHSTQCGSAVSAPRYSCFSAGAGARSSDAMPRSGGGVLSASVVGTLGMDAGGHGRGWVVAGADWVACGAPTSAAPCAPPAADWNRGRGGDSRCRNRAAAPSPS